MRAHLYKNQSQAMRTPLLVREGNSQCGKTLLTQRDVEHKYFMRHAAVPNIWVSPSASGVQCVVYMPGITGKGAHVYFAQYRMSDDIQTPHADFFMHLAATTRVPRKYTNAPIVVSLPKIRHSLATATKLRPPKSASRCICMRWGQHGELCPRVRQCIGA